MRHFHRTHIGPEAVLALADDFFSALGLSLDEAAARSRTFTGSLGTVAISARPEGGHYTMVEAATDQVGESRLDRNVKRFYVRVHRIAEPTHRLTAAY